MPRGEPRRRRWRARSRAFAAPLLNPFGLVDVGGRTSPEIADLDGDGDLDVLVGDYYGRSVVFENILVDPDACTDGFDNDGDGVADLGSDPGCANASDTSEHSSVQCDNGLDDDFDGKIAWRGDGTGDPHCSSPTDKNEFAPPSGGCGIGPELLLLVPSLAAARRRLRALALCRGARLPGASNERVECLLAPGNGTFRRHTRSPPARGRRSRWPSGYAE